VGVPEIKEHGGGSANYPHLFLSSHQSNILVNAMTLCHTVSYVCSGYCVIMKAMKIEPEFTEKLIPCGVLESEAYEKNPLCG
jgi:hypothetical protein